MSHGPGTSASSVNLSEMQILGTTPDSLNQGLWSEAQQSVFQQAFQRYGYMQKFNTDIEQVETPHKSPSNAASFGKICRGGMRHTNLSGRQAGTHRSPSKRYLPIQVALLIRQKHSKDGNAFFKKRRIERKLWFHLPLVVYF